MDGEALKLLTLKLILLVAVFDVAVKVT